MVKNKKLQDKKEESLYIEKAVESMIRSKKSKREKLITKDIKRQKRCKRRKDKNKTVTRPVTIFEWLAGFGRDYSPAHTRAMLSVSILPLSVNEPKPKPEFIIDWRKEGF